MRRQASTRKPPPRVDSTQPRETSPEPSSSGEETAGEERFSVAPPEVINNGHGNHHHWPINGNGANVPTADDDPDWIDEQEEGDEDDLLELEYHPNYISNVEKRRRKWEMGWEALVQAVSFFCFPFFFERRLIFHPVPKPRSPDRRNDGSTRRPIPQHQAPFHALPFRPPSTSPRKLKQHDRPTHRIQAHRRSTPFHTLNEKLPSGPTHQLRQLLRGRLRRKLRVPRGGPQTLVGHCSWEFGYAWGNL